MYSALGPSGPQPMVTESQPCALGGQSGVQTWSQVRAEGALSQPARPQEAGLECVRGPGPAGLGVRGSGSGQAGETSPLGPAR